MSLNAAIEQKYIPQVEVLSELLGEFILKWKLASTLEQRLIIEAEAVSLFEQLINLNLELEDLIEGEHPEINEINHVYDTYSYALKTSIARLRSITKQFLKYFNTTQFSIMELVGRLKRIRQKQAALALWNQDKARYALAERFLNFDNLGSNYQSLAECDVDVNQGLLTLPVRLKTAISVTNIKIGSGSNGQPGNSDLAVTTNNLNPSFILNNNDQNWFEYERLDTGPCELTLILELAQAEIVNNISLEAVNLGTSIPFDIFDITFSSSGSETVSIKDLISSNYATDFFTVKTVGNDTAWNVTFLPVQAKTIAIKFRASKAYQIETATSDDSVVLRDRYTVALRSVSINRIQFEKTGGINSLETPLKKSLYACIPFIDVWPPTPELFDFTLDMSFDGGETWKSSTTLDDGIGSTVLMTGDETSCIWRLGVDRVNDSFNNLNSFIIDPSTIYKTESLLRSVSRFSSPTEIPLPNKPVDNTVQAIQPKITRRGDKNSGIIIGQGTGTDVRFTLPFDAVGHRLVGEMRVFVNGVEYELELDESSLAAGQYSFSDDYKDIIFTNALSATSKVEVVLEKEAMLFEERSDGFYYKTALLFDPDKDNIEISYLPRDTLKHSMILPRNQKLIYLGAHNILEDTFKLVSQDGNTYTEVTSRTDAINTANSYYVDYVNGTIRFNARIESDTVRVSFEHQSYSNVSTDSFEIVYENALPWGVRLAKDTFTARKVTETISDATFKRIGVQNGNYYARVDTLLTATNAKTLSYDKIVRNSLKVSDNLFNADLDPEEVEFIDGKTEFIGLIPMLNEKTIETDAAIGNDYVSFTLAGGALLYEPFDVMFSNATVFSNKVSSASAARTGSTGDYHVSSTGLVTVNVGGGTLPGDILINYYYRDPDFDSANKYSVDYENGLLFAETALNGIATVEYKSANYRIAYDVAKHINGVTYDSATNSVSVRTENLLSMNSLVKLLWKKSTEQSSFKALKDYFSPLITLIGFRFS